MLMPRWSTATIYRPSKSKQGLEPRDGVSIGENPDPCVADEYVLERLFPGCLLGLPDMLPCIYIIDLIKVALGFVINAEMNQTPEWSRTRWWLPASRPTVPDPIPSCA